MAAVRRRVRGRAVLSAALAAMISLAANASADAGAQKQPEPVQPGVGPETKLPLPRYVSIRAETVNARRGPGLDYRIDWVFQRAGLPVRIVDEYDHWRRIVDSDDAGGWVYHALLTSRRSALVTAPEATLRAEPAETAAATAVAQQGVVARLVRCQPDWCEVEAGGVAGWVPKSSIWGVDPDETFGK